VSYERLTADTAGTLQRLCGWIGLDDRVSAIEGMLAGYADSAPQLIRNEPWKKGVESRIVDRNAARADVFTAAERERLRRAVDADQGLLADIPFI
jgi:hypothetical protein